MELRLDIDMREVERRLTGGLARQIPFTLSYMNHNLAHDARRKVISRLDDDFIIRSGRVAKGIQVLPRKPNKRNPDATIGSFDAFMLGQAFKATQEGAQFVPMVGKGKPRPKPTSKTPPSRWPGGKAWKIKDKETGEESDNVFLGVPKYHRAAGRNSGKIRGVWRRVVRGRGKNKVKGLSLLYRVATAVPSPGKWPLERYVRETVRDNLAKRATEAIDYAIRTAK